MKEIEEKIKETEFIEEGVDGFSRGKYYKISERDFRKLQKDIRRQALEEANSKLEKAILDEMMIARQEGQPTSRLTSLYNSLLNKSDK